MQSWQTFLVSSNCCSPSSPGSEGDGGSLSERPAARRSPGGLHPQRHPRHPLRHQPRLPDHRPSGRAPQGQRDPALPHLLHPHAGRRHFGCLPGAGPPPGEGQGEGEERPSQAAPAAWPPQRPRGQLLLRRPRAGARPRRQAAERPGRVLREAAPPAGALRQAGSAESAGGGGDAAQRAALPLPGPVHQPGAWEGGRERQFIVFLSTHCGFYSGGKVDTPVWILT